MSRQQAVSEAVARVLSVMADSLDADRPGGEMTNAARIGLVCQFIPGQPDLLDDVLPAAPEVPLACSRREYAAELRYVVRGMR